MIARDVSFVLVVIVTAAIGGSTGYYLAQRRADSTIAASAQLDPTDVSARQKRNVLYWYDPMMPDQHFDAPGKSPFMDMQLVPRYANEADSAGVLAIDPAVSQNLGIRTARTTRSMISERIDATATLVYDDRDVAIVQARADGFVERAYAHAPGDRITRNAALADVLVPSWAGAQSELLALRGRGDGILLGAARKRLRLLGMSEELIARVEHNDKIENVITLTSPIAGIIRELEVRRGMTLAAGQTLARINGIARVWLEIAVPETRAAPIRVGDPIVAHLYAFPGEVFAGKVIAILPEARLATRTFMIRAELSNPDGRLRPGMFAEVEIAAGPERAALMAPSEAVIRTGRRMLVFVAKGAGRFQPRAVTIGSDHDGMTEISSGLVEGEEVVASGQFLLDAEASFDGLVPSYGTEATPQRSNEP